MKNCLGIEIGNYRIKIAYMEKGVLKEWISERIEEGAKPDARLCAETIRDLLAQKMIRCKKVVFVLRQEDSYVKKFKLPLMTTEQLKLNLPYEFQDYIGERLDAFQYDYAMIDRTDDGMELLAAACRKELCQQFEKIAKLAKLKIVGIVPSAIGLERILELTDAIRANLDLPVKSLGELAPEVDLEKMPEWLDSPQTYGVLLA